MTVFDFKEVQELAEVVRSQLTNCENGEGMECGNFENSLRCYAKECNGFVESVRQWAHGVFSGRIPFEASVEHLWLAELLNLQKRIESILAYAWEAESDCYSFDAKGELQFAKMRLDYLLDHWVSPKRSVGPAARVRLSADFIRENAIK